MALKRDLSDLPPAEPEPSTDGNQPDQVSRFVTALVHKWDRERQARAGTGRTGGRKRTAPFWLSDAGKCSRYLALSALQVPVPPEGDMDLSGVWNVNLGEMIHKEWQAAILEVFPGAIVEYRALLPVEKGHRTLFAIDPERSLLGSGYLDLVVTLPGPDGTPGIGPKVVVELKSQGGYGFKASVGKIRRDTPAEGAKVEHILQGALGGLAADTPDKPTDEVVIGYLAKECISVGQASGLTDDKRFSAEWTFTRDQWEPMARAELSRVAGIVALIDGGHVAARKAPELPPGAEVTDPMTGQWKVPDESGLKFSDVGKYWACAYCRHQATCVELGPGRQPIEAAVAIGQRTDPTYVWPIPDEKPTPDPVAVKAATPKAHRPLEFGTDAPDGFRYAVSAREASKARGVVHLAHADATEPGTLCGGKAGLWDGDHIGGRLCRRCIGVADATTALATPEPETVPA